MKCNTVESGEKAVEFLRENPQDLVLLDIMMPGGIDGVETYRQFLRLIHIRKQSSYPGFQNRIEFLKLKNYAPVLS